jgi:hypothetical protein
VTWVNYAIAPILFILALLILIEFRRWQNKKTAENKILLEILPPTGQEYYALATKDERRLIVKSPTRKDVKHAYFVDKQATWDSEYPASDIWLTRVSIKKVIYIEGQKEPAVKRPIKVIDGNGKTVNADVEIANPTMVALTKDSDDLAAIIREVNGNTGLFGANTGLVTFIVCALVLIVSAVSVYYDFQNYNRILKIRDALGIIENPIITPVPKAK